MFNDYENKMEKATTRIAELRREEQEIQDQLGAARQSASELAAHAAELEALAASGRAEIGAVDDAHRELAAVRELVGDFERRLEIRRRIIAAARDQVNEIKGDEDRRLSAEIERYRLDQNEKKVAEAKMKLAHFRGGPPREQPDLSQCRIVDARGKKPYVAYDPTEPIPQFGTHPAHRR